MNVAQYIIILGFAISLNGIHRFYQAIKVDPQREIVVHQKDSHQGAIIDFVEARTALRFLVYGFLIQAASLVLP